MKPILLPRKVESSRSEKLLRSCPSTHNFPDVGRSKAPIMLSIVLFPEPEVPTSANNSPRRTTKLIPRSASTGGLPG